MFRIVLLSALIVACNSHAVPVVVPTVHHAPLLAPYSAHGYGGPGLLGHGWLAKPLGHHILKRSPHLVAPLAHGGHIPHVGLAHVAPVAHVAPLALSHQSRVEVHSSPAFVAAPIIPVVKPVIAPLLHAAPVLHKSFITGPLGFGAGHYGHYASLYPHHGHF